jgi:hypothetical protein
MTHAKSRAKERRARAWRSYGWGVVLLAASLLPTPAGALLTVQVTDIDDPVPPGGIITYDIELTSTTSSIPYCFNPPPSCVGQPAVCSVGSPQCVGDSFIGFVCLGSANDGTDCGVGDPPVPDVRLCVAQGVGTCNGGSSAGLTCTGNIDCPGSTYVCMRALNEGEYCGSGIPAIPIPAFCLQRPLGICSSGGAVGLPCTAPHGYITAECPGGDPPPPLLISVPIPPGTTFLDADNNAVTDGVNVTWTLPAVALCGLGGPECPRLEARFLVDSTATMGSTISTQVTGSDVDGVVTSVAETTTIGVFGRTKAVLTYPRSPGRDSIFFRARFTLTADQTLNPLGEAFRFQIQDAVGTIVDFPLNPGALQSTGSYHRIQGWSYRSRGAGLSRVALEQKFGHTYWLRIAGRRLDMPDLRSNTVTVIITIGDDVFTTSITLIPNITGRRFIKTAQ